MTLNPNEVIQEIINDGSEILGDGSFDQSVGYWVQQAISGGRKVGGRKRQTSGRSEDHGVPSAASQGL